MAKDYSKKNRSSGKNKNTRQRNKNTKSTPGWVWLFSGLCVGLMIAAFMYISTRPVSDPTHEVRDEQIAQPEDVGENKKASDQDKEDEKRHYDFYEMLKNYKIEVDESDDLPAPKEGDKNAQYIIQVGSFGHRDDAKRQQAKVTLLGIKVSVNQAKLKSGETVYRVQTEPLGSQNQISKILAKLKKANIDSQLTRKH